MENKGFMKNKRWYFASSKITYHQLEGIKWWLSDSSFHWISWKDIIPNLLRFLRDDIDWNLQKHQIQNSMSLHYRREYRLLAIFPSPDLSKLKSPGSHSYQLVRCVLWQAARGTYKGCTLVVPQLSTTSTTSLVIIEAADCQKSEQVPRASSGFQRCRSFEEGSPFFVFNFVSGYVLWLHILSLKTFQSVREVFSSGTSFWLWAPAWLLFPISTLTSACSEGNSTLPTNHPYPPIPRGFFLPCRAKHLNPLRQRQGPWDLPRLKRITRRPNVTGPPRGPSPQRSRKRRWRSFLARFHDTKKHQKKKLQEKDSHL